MKKFIAFMLILLLFITLFATVSVAVEEQTTIAVPQESTTAIDVSEPEEPIEPTEPTEPTDPVEPSEPTGPTEPTEVIEDVVSLDGKTILIVGNSMVYYGNCVLLGDQGKADYGYFYQLIASNGENATVIDHTYPGKKLDFIYDNYLVKLSAEERAKVNYLVLSEGNQYNDNLVGTCEKIIDLFPNIEGFRFLRQPNMFDVDDESLYLPVLIEQVEKLREAGYEIVDWGKLVRDIFTGEIKVPGATLEFHRTTFMKENKGYKNAEGTAVSQGNKGDRNHQNPLSGYVTAQMLYTSLTNRSAVFSDYSFCGDKTISIYMDLPEFDRVHYTGKEKSNFRQVFASAVDMLGLQKLIDIYIAKEGRHPLTVQKEKAPDCISNGLTQGSYCSICGKVASAQQIIESNGEHKLVFHKGKEETCTEDGITDGITCENCNVIIKDQKKIPARVHSGKQIITLATTSTDGSIKRNCKYCNAEYEKITIKAVKSISLSANSFVYNGNEQKPSVTVVDVDGKTLVSGKDYKVSYDSGCILPGKYTVNVTLTGNYSGVHKLSFNIHPQAVASVKSVSTTDSITLSWSAVEGAGYYRIYKLNEKTNTYKYYDAVSATSFKVTGLSAGTKYTFKVRAVLKDEEVILSDYSSECVSSTLPDVVTKISAKKTVSTIKLSWKAVKGATAYRIYKYNPKTKAYKSVAYVTDGTSYTMKKLTAGEVYKFKIRAYSVLDCGKFIGGLSAEFKSSTKPATPVVKAISSKGKVTLTWKDVNGETGYKVYYAQKGSNEYKLYSELKANKKKAVVSSLKKGKTYKFRVRAVKTNANGTVYSGYKTVSVKVK